MKRDGRKIINEEKGYLEEGIHYGAPSDTFKKDDLKDFVDIRNMTVDDEGNINERRERR